MPELPEVETMIRGIREAITGSTIVRLELCPCDCKPLPMTPDFEEIQERCAGRTIARVRRWGKRILLEQDDDRVLVIEPRMTGLMLLADPPDVEHLRLHWTLQRGDTRRSLWFWDRRGLGTVRLFEREELERSLGEKLGPDALEITVEDWKNAFGKTSRPVKVVLLDQSVAAGIGNLYASEILHRALLSPELPARELTAKDIARLARATHDILRTAIEHEGSTLSDGTYRNALNQDGGYQNQHQVYDRAGLPCPRCESEIERIVQAQRSTFYCPRCQKLPPRLQE